MDLETLKNLNLQLKDLYREESETTSKASVSEAIGVLIESMRFILDHYQSELERPAQYDE